MWDSLTQEQRWGFMYAAMLKNAYNATQNNEETHPTNLTGEDIALARLSEVGNTLYAELFAEKTRRFVEAFQTAQPSDQMAIQTILQVPDVLS